MRTFIFGAGASIHAGYPLSSELWPALKEWVTAAYCDNATVQNNLQTLSSALDGKASFELALTDLDIEIEELSSCSAPNYEILVRRTDLIYSRSTLSYMLPQFFNSLRWHPATLYESFCQQVLNAGDTVITFNYDLALDREMRRAGKWDCRDGYGFHLSDDFAGTSPCKLFKPHGSTNWWGEHFQGATGFFAVDPSQLSLGERPVIDQSELAYLGCAGEIDKSAHEGRTRQESLIMPTAKKKFYTQTSLGREWENFWNSLWHDSAQALRSSGEVYIIGYSVPEFDDRARNLLVNCVGKKASLIVCCHSGTAGVIESLRRIISAEVRPADGLTFEEWLKGMINRSF